MGAEAAAARACRDVALATPRLHLPPALNPPATQNHDYPVHRHNDILHFYSVSFRYIVLSSILIQWDHQLSAILHGQQVDLKVRFKFPDIGLKVSE